MQKIMTQLIKIKFQKSPTEKYCKKCKWRCIFPQQENEGPYCILFDNGNELIVENKQICRCSKCIQSQFYENGKRYLKYEIFDFDEETCGGCLLQYYDFTGKICGYSVCPAFNAKIYYKQGLTPEGDDIYELHYRCKACKRAIINKK